MTEATKDIEINGQKVPTPEVVQEAVATGKPLNAPTLTTEQVQQFLAADRIQRGKQCHAEVMATLQKYRCKLDVQGIINADGIKLDARIIAE